MTNETIKTAVQAYLDNKQTIFDSIPSEYVGNINQTAILESIKISGKTPKSYDNSLA